ncbi:MAG: D-glucosaminate-6-phosphate ammonia-lyase [Acetobacteraceae bacterium]|jgi:D-glucosaminate-6-phosphate ammonia-lyase|nr:D-glucosaminate-6-phosphate ammonia-lyase [Acetobacteraceae bacterium]
MNDVPTDVPAAIRNANPYLALGVRPFINCASVRTAHSGSLMLPEVRAAIDQASRQFVSLDELMEGASRRIAELTGAEWGIVTCGSAAALTLATTACVAGNDPVKMLRLPFTDGWTNRVIMLKNQRFAYDQAIRMVGTHIVEIETIADLDAALLEPVAMIAVLGTHEAASLVRLEDIVSRAAPRGIPVLVDAASEHIERPSPYLARGADMVIYSGGKFLRGPQTSGLLLGRKELIQAAWRNASPHQAFARGMKVSKEDVIGVLAALEVWFEQRDPAAELRRWNMDLTTIAGRLGLPGVSTEVIAPHGVVRVPRLRVSWDTAKIALDGETLRLRLLDGEPRIMLDDMSTTGNSVDIDPFGLQPGEADQVGRGIGAALAAPVIAAKSVPTATDIDLSGTWDVVVSFLKGERTHRIQLRQHNGAITGSQASHQFEGPVTGNVDGKGISLIFRTWHEGTLISYRLDGSVADGQMRGNVTFGSATHHHQGAINLAQFGPGWFQGVRAR